MKNGLINHLNHSTYIYIYICLHLKHENLIILVKQDIPKKWLISFKSMGERGRGEKATDKAKLFDRYVFLFIWDTSVLKPLFAHLKVGPAGALALAVPHRAVIGIGWHWLLLEGSDKCIFITVWVTTPFKRLKTTRKITFKRNCIFFTTCVLGKVSKTTKSMKKVNRRFIFLIPPLAQKLTA